MIQEFALVEQAKHLQSLVTSAEIEINGIFKPMNLTSAREGTKVRFFIDVPATETGKLTCRILKGSNGEICWSDPPGKFLVEKTNTDLRTEIPILANWKEGSST